MDVAPLAMMSWISLAGLAVLSDPRLLAERALREKSVAKQAKKQSSKLSAGETAAHQTAGSVQKRRAFQVAGAGLALAMMAFGLRPLLADVAARTGMRKSSSMEEALGHLMRADKLNPWTSTYQVMPTTLVVRQARSLPEDSQEGVFQQAHHWLEGVAKNTPSNQFAAMNLARVNEFWAAKNSATRYPVAHRWWRRAVELNPSAWRLKLKYGAFLGDWALQTDDAAPKQAALSVLRDLSESEPGRPEVWLALGKAYVLRGDINRAKIALDEALRIRPEYLEARTWRQRLHVPERPPSTAGPAPAS